ncbi:MAG: hypothetical protein JWM84_3295 [Nocardioides sp.]|nr:hypothetical protein [Nocardioides sp.]
MSIRARGVPGAVTTKPTKPTKPTKKNLVLARVGRKSLHPSWLDGDVNRDWDLVLVPYQPLAPQDDLDCEVADVIPGPKWSGLREFLGSWDGWRDYDQVWMPDDDILTTPDTINRMFATAGAVGLDLFAPALQDASYFAHFSTMQNHSFSGRWTGFVEIMMPGFSASALDRLLPTLELSETGWGWGLDSLWPKLLGHRDVGVIDSTPVLHTRPVGRMRDEELRRRVVAESDRILSDYDCRQEHTTFGAFGPDDKRVELDPEAFFVELVRGWQHLIDADPRVLTWLVHFQQQLFEWPAYPVEGTPAGGWGRLSDDI